MRKNMLCSVIVVFFAKGVELIPGVCSQRRVGPFSLRFEE
jgi:hypothetical protein